MPRKAEETEQGQTPDEETPGKKKGLVLPLLLALTAAAVGGAVGTVLLGPSLGPWLAARGSQDQGSSGGGGHGGGHGGGGGQRLHSLENLVVNPAGSQGTRYLLVSVAVEPKEPGMIEDLATLDVPLRHELLAILGAKTVEELSDIERREELVEELEEGLAHVVGEGVISRIYLPQYVIQ